MLREEDLRYGIIYTKVVDTKVTFLPSVPCLDRTHEGTNEGTSSRTVPSFGTFVIIKNSPKVEWSV